MINVMRYLKGTSGKKTTFFLACTSTMTPALRPPLLNGSVNGQLTAIMSIQDTSTSTDPGVCVLCVCVFK